ncbi:MAG: cytochrome c oxidase subunit II [Actinomycetota bacterium]|nr:cytochrome c oxidase subunit II [Actinomycetota bacterium]
MKTVRSRAFAAVVAVGLLAAACGSESSPSTLDPKGPGAERIADVWWLMFGLAAAVYVVVASLIVAAAVRGRGTEGEGRPSRITDSTFIWVGGVIGPAAILGILAVVTVDATEDLRGEERRAPLRVEVTGYRWWWDVRYPDEGIVTANEIHIPAGRPIDVRLRTADVIHSFWVPELAGKLDQIPGQLNVLRLQADRPGVYRGFCAEFCGLQHAKMQFLVIAEPAADFARWVARQQRPPGPPVSERAAFGQVVFNRSSCAGCHAIRGTESRGSFGPNLSDFGSRRTIGAVSIPNTPGHLAGWISDSQSIKPGNLMPPVYLKPDELLAVVEYLESLK